MVSCLLRCHHTEKSFYFRKCISISRLVCSGLEGKRASKNHRSPECSFVAQSQLLHCDVTEICPERVPSYHHKYEEMNMTLCLYICFYTGGGRTHHHQQQKRRRILIRIRSMPNCSNDILHHYKGNLERTHKT